MADALTVQLPKTFPMVCQPRSQIQNTDYLQDLPNFSTFFSIFYLGYELGAQACPVSHILLGKTALFPRPLQDFPQLLHPIKIGWQPERILFSFF